ncbi:MAG: hypothetical protein JRD68_12795 [Deltaproteobacteria bacterium]|nr:hypothetical protein [Deltaproteobacteria bacterium]
MTDKEKKVRDRIERRFKGHENDKIMMALKKISTRYLIDQMRENNE